MIETLDPRRTLDQAGIVMLIEARFRATRASSRSSALSSRMRISEALA